MDRDIIHNFGNLYTAYRRAKKGKRKKGSCGRFQSMSLQGVHMLKDRLESQEYKMDPYFTFEIREPKVRIIMACAFKDKVVQHCLCDELLHPRLKNVFIRTNYAGQKGKGTHFAMNCLKEQMLDFYQKHGLDGWILKCDIRKFFYRISHEVAKDIVDYYFPDDYTKWLNHLLIDSTEDPGAPLGNQAASVYALLMLDGMDKMITGELGIEHYGRYSDDFYLISHSKSYLEYCLEHIEELAAGLKLELNGKTQFIPFRKGLSFLGFHHYVTADGKYIRKIKGTGKRAMKKKLRKQVRRVKDGQMEKEKMLEKYNSWKAHASHGNCIKLIQSMDEYLEELLRE